MATVAPVVDDHMADGGEWLRVGTARDADGEPRVGSLLSVAEVVKIIIDAIGSKM